MIRFAILGAGHIAGKMAQTIRGMQARGEDVALYAVASRSIEKAQAFAGEWGAARAYGSYEEMARDDQVDLVYIATPNAQHAEHIRLCVEHGRAVLCEKSFTGNAAQAEEVLALARARGVLVAEAIWTRYMPSRQIINDLLAEGVIGEPTLVMANLSYNVAWKERIQSPALGGGALLDLGVYTLNFASMVFGDDVVQMDSSAGLFPTGVDHTENITLYYRDGRMAHLSSCALTPSDRRAVVCGTRGYLAVDNVNNPLLVEVFDDSRSGVPLRSIPMPEQITGYEYEVRACMRALAAGKTECPEMPHAQTLHIMRVMDALRAQWGVRFPFDEA